MTHVLPTEKTSPLTRRQTDCDACARARRSPVYYTAAAVNDNDSARSASRVRTLSGQKKMTQMVAGREDNVFHYVDLWMNLPL